MSVEEKNESGLYEVKIGGISLTLKTSHDRDTVNELSRVVEDKIQKSLSKGQNIPFQKALLLAALNLAEDLLLFKRAAEDDLNKLEYQAQRILSDLESSPISSVQIDN